MRQLLDPSSPQTGQGLRAPTESKVPTRSDHGDNKKPIAGTTASLGVSPPFTIPTPSATMVPSSAGTQQAGDPPNENPVVQNNEYSSYQQPPTTGQHGNTLVGKEDEPGPQQKEKLLSRLTNPFTRKIS